MIDFPPDLDPQGKIAWLKMTGQDSCTHCAYLYFQDTGYSNYTVEDTDVYCALDRNPKLPASKPYDWEFERKGNGDNWAKTQHGACDQLLELGEDEQHAALDVDGEYTAYEYDLPLEAQIAISGEKK